MRLPTSWRFSGEAAPKLGLKIITYSIRCRPYGPAWPFKNQQTWSVFHFVKALKGDALNNSAEIPMLTGSPLRYLNRDNQVEAFDIFAEMVAPTRPEKRPTVVLVPIPGCKAICADDVRRGTTYRMAEAIGQRLGVKVEPCLWWSEPMLSSHRENGPRDPAILVPKLVLGAVPTGSVVLVDDVLTSGGHLRAAHCMLRRAGARVLFGVCAAKQRDAEEGDMFKRVEHELEEFDE